MFVIGVVVITLTAMALCAAVVFLPLMFPLLIGRAGKPIARRTDDRAGDGRDHRVLVYRSLDGLTHWTNKLLPAVGLLAANLST